MKTNNFLSNIFTKNIIFSLGLGLTLALGVTHSFELSLWYGLIFIIVIVLATLISNLLKKVIEPNIVINITIVSTLVIIICLLLHAFVYQLSIGFGIFLPLMAVSGAVLLMMGKADEDITLGNSVLNSLGTGIGFLLMILVISLVREILGSGAIAFNYVLNGSIKIFSEKYIMSLLLGPVGAFLIAGIVGIIFSLIFKKETKKEVLS